MEISLNFVASSEYMKFKQLDAAFLQDIYFVNTPHTIWALPIKNEKNYINISMGLNVK